MPLEFAALWDRFMRDMGYARRPAQDSLVGQIKSTIQAKKQLVARAGTGTGKSIAAVIPALAYARAGQTGPGPVMITTASKNLQGQYFLKDLPRMAEAYSDHNGQGFTFALLKGKSNYLCRERLKSPGGFVRPVALELLRSLPDGHSGDIAMLDTELSSQERRALTMNSNDCPGKAECTAHTTETPCYYEKQKAHALSSDVVVINHALLAQDIKIFVATNEKIEILPKPSTLIIDECHKFSGYMQNALGWNLTVARLFRWANDCLDQQELERFKVLTRRFFSQVKDTRDETQTKYKKPDVQQVVPRPTLRAIPEIKAMLETVEDALDEWTEVARDSRQNADWRKVRRTANLLADLSTLSDPMIGDNFWSEPGEDSNRDKGGTRSISLNYKPSTDKVAAYLAEHFWSNETPAILMSATPPVNPSDELGIPDNHDTFDASSPFDYYNNSRLFIAPTNGKAPIDRDGRMLWEQKRHQTMLNLVAASDGRALLLFSAWTDLNRAHEVLAPKFQAAGVTVLKQDRDDEATRDKLAARFKEDEHSVLFGTQSFFEGVDIPGTALQLVIIYKMPFPSLHDATRGGNLDFKTEMLPEMRQHLVQAAGRLIRSHDDRGLIAILDNRIATASYGKSILANVEPFNRMQYVNNLDEAMAYLESLETEDTE